MELSTWIITALSLLLGCWIQTALGFGMAVFAAPILVMVEPLWVPAVITFTALLLSILNTWDQKHSLQAKQLYIPMLTRIPGTLIGAWLLMQLTIFWLQVCVAICVLLAVLVSYFGKQFPYTPTRLAIASFVSGITGTTTSIGGPPMALVMQHGDPKTVRANLSFFFVYSCSVSIAAYAYMGLLTDTILLVSLSLIPVCIIGFILGKKTQPYVDAGRFRPLLLTLCACAGLIALFGAIKSF